MKIVWVSLVAVTLVACAQNSGPNNQSQQDWFQFGEQQALVGYEKQSDTELKQASQVTVSAELYQAYSEGYQQGRSEYCQQDPRILGKKGEMYRGICDDIRPTFRTWYNNGKASRSSY
ncbi:DUF2799 domain-containing protein [Vibrio sp. 10N]|uniref:DUF2799 domain-containing protein n=1 Tax=Vibrio sp. 10N TaxID=3058938 RepID=UPI0028143078|nr:DUF2799 domain-containing protein [Vibrio sp. 10N]